MNEHSEETPDWEIQRNRIIGLGETSIRKSYYPELQQRISELEEKNRKLQEAYVQQTATEQELHKQSDVTGRKELELRESEERFRQIFENSSLGMALVTPDFRFFSVNLAWVSMTGYSKEELLKMSFTEITHPDHLAGDQEHIRRLMAGLIPLYNTEKRYIRKDGSILWGLIRVTTIRDQQGSVRYLAAQIEDITERKRVEVTLRESEERFRTLIEASPVPIVLVHNRIFMYTNSAFCRMTGYDCKAEVMGKDLLDFVAPECREKVAGFVAARQRGEPAEQNYEAIGIRHDGSRFPYEITLSVIQLSDGPATMAFINDITGRKKAEEALTRNAELLQRAELVAGLGHWEFDLETRVVYASDGARSVYGLSDRQWTIPEVQNIPLPEYRPMLDASLQALVKDNQPYDVEFRIKRPTDGIILNVHSIAEYDKKAGIVFGVIQDITEQKRSETAVKESEKKYRNIVETTPDLIWEIDLSGRFTYLSPQILDVLGYRPEDLMGKSFFVLIPPDQIPPVKNAFEAQVSGSSSLVTIDVIGIHADGHLVDLEIRSKTATDEKGNQTGFRGITRDITERKETGKALQISEERYRSLVDITDTGYIVLDKQGRVLDSNDVYLRLTGRSSLADLIGHSVTEWTAPYDLERNAQEVEKCLSVGHVRNLEIDYLKPDGTIQSVEINATVFHAGTGDVILTICRDISDRKRTLVSLQQARNKLNLLNAVTFQDIQTAAFSLSAYQELVKTVLTDARAKTYLDKQELFLKKMTDTLAFAKNYQEMGMHPPRWQNVRQVFLYAISHLDFLHMKQNLQVANLEIFADPLFEKALFNLMENTLSHGVKASEVTIRYEEKPDHLTLIIEDNGIGIFAEEKNMIFDRGYGKGSGLGLFLVREALSITGMTIRETGTYGKGTRFEIMVPKGMYRNTG